jgi:hypothetical protein
MLASAAINTQVYSWSDARPPMVQFTPQEATKQTESKSRSVLIWSSWRSVTLSLPTSFLDPNEFSFYASPSLENYRKIRFFYQPNGAI